MDLNDMLNFVKQQYEMDRIYLLEAGFTQQQIETLMRLRDLRDFGELGGENDGAQDARRWAI